MNSLLEFKGITKRFPGVLALDNVGFQVGAGEVVALIGENGAGKSTLMKTLGGVHQADSGSIEFDSRPVTIRSVSDAITLGIAFIHQELNVLDNLDIAGNIFLGREPAKGGPLRLIDQKQMRRESEVHLRRLGINLPASTPLRQLSIAQQQMVEIAKALSLNARLIIMDEPTSSLTLSETQRLLDVIAELRSSGVSVIYISHRLAEIEQCADRVVALRDGKNAGGLERESITHANMVALMVGRKLENLYVQGKATLKPGYFEVSNLRTAYRPQHPVSFTVAGGEILGMAGLVGAGRSEMAQTIFGVDRMLEGEIRLDGNSLRISRASDAIKSGIYLVPEDRRKTGLVTDMTVRENITLAGLDRCANMGLINFSKERETAKKETESLRVKTASIETRAANLSGGNQQKVVLAKWLSLNPRVIIFDEPTRGIDIGARAEIYRLMRDLADRGVALIMISSDMEEVLGVSDRIAVMHEGRISGILSRDQFSEKTIMNLAVGKSA